MTMKNIKETKIPHLNKSLIGNYHYGLNIEHAKHVLEKVWYWTRCWETFQLPLSKQREGNGVLQSSMYMYSSQI